MKEKESHPIRNGTIATVMGGVILSFWTPFRDLVDKVFLLLWTEIIHAWNYLISAHEIYGWLIIVLIFLSAPTIIRVIGNLIKNTEPSYTELYQNDHLYGAEWHWNYINGAISNLWCLCPQCQTELVFSEYIPNRLRIHEHDKSPSTEFICERCRVTRVLLEGKRSYALATVEREVRRKIRTGEWRRNESSS